MRRLLWPVTFGALALVLAGGCAAWVLGEDGSKEADLGANVVAGAVVALAILVLERSLRRADERREVVRLLAMTGELKGIDLRGADLRAAYANGKDLREARLGGADLREAQLAEAHLARADLRRADLRDADLRWANASQASFVGADMRSAALGAASLAGADFSDCDLRGAALFASPAGGPVESADLRGAALYGADLRDLALVVRDRLHTDYVVVVAMEKAKANDETRWPAGFDPRAAGVTVLTGDERQAHDFYVAFTHPGLDDLTATAGPKDWQTRTRPQ